MATLSISGTPLDHPNGKWRILASTSLPTLSLPENEIIQIPFVDDRIAIPGPVSARPYAISLWIPNRTRPSYDAITETLSELAPILAAGRILTWHPDQGPGRSAQILTLTASRPEPDPDRTGARLTLDLSLAPYWEEEGPTKSQNLTPRNGTSSVELTEWQGATAPLTHAQIRITGPATSISISHANRTALTITTPIPQTQTALADLASHRVTINGAPIPYDYGPEGILRLEPNISTGKIPLSIAAAGTSSQTRITVIARRTFR